MINWVNFLYVSMVYKFQEEHFFGCWCWFACFEFVSLQFAPS